MNIWNQNGVIKISTLNHYVLYVSNEHGGFIYDPIGSNILDYTTTTTTNTVERLNSKENLH